MLTRILLCLIFIKYLNLQASSYHNLVKNEGNTNIQTDRAIVQCVSKIVKENIPCGNIITTITADSFHNILKTINDETCHSLVIRSIQRQRWLMPTDAYLILLNHASELPLTLLEISKDLLWNPAAKFIIAAVKITPDEITEVFNKLLKHRIYTVIILSLVDSQIFTYYPFANNSCGNTVEHFVNLGFCYDESIVISDKLYNSDDLKDYRGCSIVVGIKEVVPYTTMSKNTDLKNSQEYKIGIEQFVMENIAMLEGIEIKYKLFSEDVFRGVVLDNNSATGILSYLQNGEVSAVIGGFTLILNRITVFDNIWGYNYASFKIVTRAATDIMWKKVYRTFGIQSWILIVISLCVMSTITLLIQIVLSKKHEDPVIIILKLLDYLLDHSDQNLFTNRNLRLLLLFWIWYTYFINSFYKTAYYSLITGNVKDNRNFDGYNLSTFPYAPCVSEFGRSYFLYAYNLTFPDAKWIKECTTTDNNLDFIAEKDDFYTLTTEYVYFRNAHKFIDDAGNFKLDSWRLLDSTISTIYCNRGFPLRNNFQKHALHIFESGIIQFHLYMMNVKRRHLTQNNKYFKNLTISDFIVSYYILLIGSVISLFCFLIERYSRPIINKNKN